jgi:hypothetical protein
MENEEKLMTGEESLRVITDMISKTRVGITQPSFHLLLWGWLIFACGLSEFLLWKYACRDGYRLSYPGLSTQKKGQP